MIDAHVHLWDATLRYSWREALPKGDRLRRDAPPAALLAALPAPLEGIVHVEASADDPLAETRWLAQATAALPCPVALIAHVPMTAPDARERLDAQAAQPGVVGIRDSAALGPGLSGGLSGDPRRLDSAPFREAAQAAAHLGLAFDLAISPLEAEAAARLARDVPGLRLVLSHCGGPQNDGPEARALWRDGLERLAEQPNVTVKLCDPMALPSGASRNWLLDVLAICLDIFGPSRAAYGSRWPLTAQSPAKWAGIVAETVADLHPAAQARVWSGTARALYFQGPRQPLPARGSPPA